jgi:hypothetical protein
MGEYQRGMLSITKWELVYACQVGVVILSYP